MNASTPLPTEVLVLAWSMVVFFGQMMLQGATALREQGFHYNAGPRDGGRPLGRIAGRAQRTFDNFKETYPLFIGLALGLAVAGRGGGIADTGAWMWLFARIVYVPLYLAGVPWLRTCCWGVSMLGLTFMFARLV